MVAYPPHPKADIATSFKTMRLHGQFRIRPMRKVSNHLKDSFALKSPAYTGGSEAGGLARPLHGRQRLTDARFEISGGRPTFKTGFARWWSPVGLVG